FEGATGSSPTLAGGDGVGAQSQLHLRIAAAGTRRLPARVQRERTGNNEVTEHHIEVTAAVGVVLVIVADIELLAEIVAVAQADADGADDEQGGVRVVDGQLAAVLRRVVELVAS